MAHGDQAFGGGSFNDRREAPFSGLSGSGLVKDTISPKGGRNGSVVNAKADRPSMEDMTLSAGTDAITPTPAIPIPTPSKIASPDITDVAQRFLPQSQRERIRSVLAQQQDMSTEEAEEGGGENILGIGRGVAGTPINQRLSQTESLIDYMQKTTAQPTFDLNLFESKGDATQESYGSDQTKRYGEGAFAYNALNLLPGTTATRTYGGPTETISGDKGFEFQTTFNPLSGLIGTAAAVGTLGLSAAAGKIPTGLGMLVGSMTKDLEIPVGSFNKEQRTKLAAQKAQLVKEGLLSADRVTQYTPSEPSEGRDDQPIKKPVLPRGFQTNTGKAASSDIPTGSPDLAIPSGPSRARLRAFRSRRLPR